MSSFDNWKDEYGLQSEPNYSEHTEKDCKSAFEAGQQSQQDKIDELKKKYDAMYNAFIVADDCRKEWHESYMSARKECDELQVRVGEAVDYIAESGGVNLTSEIALNHILKGNKDD